MVEAYKQRKKEQQVERLRDFTDAAKAMYDTLSLQQTLIEQGYTEGDEAKWIRRAISDALDTFERATNTCVLEFEYKV